MTDRLVFTRSSTASIYYLFILKATKGKSPAEYMVQYAREGFGEGDTMRK